MKRKPISTSFTQNNDNLDVYTVTCNDGTIWQHVEFHGWQQIDGPPQPVDAVDDIQINRAWLLKHLETIEFQCAQFDRYEPKYDYLIREIYKLQNICKSTDVKP